MKTINDYLAAYAAARNLTSDYQIARDLSLTRQAVSKYRHGASAPDLDTAWRIAEAIGADPAEIIAVGEISRATRADDAARAATWRTRLQSVSASFVGVLLFGLVSAAPAIGRAATAAQYILCSIEPVSRHCLRRRSRRWLSVPICAK